MSAFFVNPQVPVYYWRQNSKRKMRGQKGVPLWRQKHMLDQKRERKKSCFGKHFQHPYVLYGLGKKRSFLCVCVCVCVKYSLFFVEIYLQLRKCKFEGFFSSFFLNILRKTFKKNGIFYVFYASGGIVIHKDFFCFQ